MATPAVTVLRRGPATLMQRRFAERHAALENQAVLNVTLRADLDGRLDLDALADALSALTARHEALRTRFSGDPAELVQEVVAPAHVRLPVTDLGSAGLPATEREAAVARWCERLARQPLRLDEAPLVRCSLAAVAGDRWVLVLVQHHIITDGVSTMVLLRDLAALYRAGVEGRAPALPPPNAQPLDFARWQAELLAGARAEALVTYWRQELDGAVFSWQLPGARPRPAALTGAGSLQEVTVPSCTARRLAASARRHGVTLYALLLAAFGELLCTLTGQNDVVFTAAFQNRTRPQFEALVGQVANSLPVRLRRRPNEEISEAVRRAGRQLWAYADHQELPFPLLLDRLAIRERPDGALFPQVWFNIHPRADPRLELPGLRVHVRDVAIPGARADLGILVVPDEEVGLRLWAESADYLGADTVAGWLARLAELLTAVVERPSALVRDW